MKLLVLWIVFPVFICLCTVSANADMLLDSFNYSSNAALQAVWGPYSAATTSLPTTATIGGVPCMDLHLNWTGPGLGTFQWCKNVCLDLSQCTALTWSMQATNPSQVFYSFVTLYMDNGASYLAYDWAAPTSQWQTVTLSKSAWGLTGTSDLANVTQIVFGFYLNANAVAGDVYISNLKAVMPSGSLNVDVTLQDYGGNLSLLPIKVDCIDSAGRVAYTSTVTPTTNPTTVAFANLYVGSYTVRASAAKFLSAITTANISNNVATGASLSLPNGDLDGNGTITSNDLNIGLASADQRGQ